MLTPNLALLLVLQFAALQFLFGHRENLFHRFAEFLGRLLLGRCRHGKRYATLVAGQASSLHHHINKDFCSRRVQNFIVIYLSKKTA